MFKNFLKVAVRNIRKQGFYALFNSLGMAMAIACSIIIYLIIQRQQNLDNFHKNASEIFAVNETHIINGVSEPDFRSPLPLAPQLKNNSPLITSAVRLYSVDVTAKKKDDAFYENIILTDDDFFNMFSFSIQAGNKNAIKNPSAIVLSYEAAKKYFGNSSALGKQLSIIFNNSYKRTFTVAAVAAPFPDNASFTFNMLANISLLNGLGLNENDWKLQTKASFIQLRSAASASQVSSLLNDYVKVYNGANPDNKIQSLYLDNLKDVPRHGYYTHNPLVIISPPAAIITLGILCIMILCLACFNFMNYALATSASRFKEIGVRKVLGSSKKQLLLQFLGENLLISLIALALAFLITQFLFLPGANKIFDYQHISFDPLNNIGLVTFLFILIIVIAVLSGLYPALKISGVNTIKIFKNKQNVKGNKGLTGTLTVLQLGFSLVTIAASIITAANAKYLSSLNVGYNKDHILVLKTDNASSFQFLENAARKRPDVLNVAGSQDQIGRTANASSMVKYENLQLNSDVINVTPEYIDLLKLAIVEGRNFLPNSQQDIDNSVIVNQKLVALMNWSNPIGKQIQADGKTYEVAGVVKDFNYENFFRKIGPCLLKMNAAENNRVLSINTENENTADLKNYLHAEWKKTMPDKPFETTLQMDVYNISYRESRRTEELLLSIAILTIIISSMGLFAQVALNIVKRTKEIGMRKILGAHFFQIAALMTKELFVLMAISAIIFLPLVFIAINNLFEVAYPYHIPLTVNFFILALLVMIAVMILTTGSLVYKAAIANPAKSLRTE